MRDTYLSLNLLRSNNFHVIKSRNGLALQWGKVITCWLRIWLMIEHYIVAILRRFWKRKSKNIWKRKCRRYHMNMMRWTKETKMRMMCRWCCTGRSALKTWSSEIEAEVEDALCLGVLLNARPFKICKLDFLLMHLSIKKIDKNIMTH